VCSGEDRLQFMQLSRCPQIVKAFLTLTKCYLDAARAGVPAADVGGRAVAGAPGAEGQRDEGAREPLAAPR
jgi:hypothetical protein